MRSLSEVKTTTVIRDGRAVTIDSDELVVGDIIHLTQGSKIQADCLILETSYACVSEALLTGEPDLIRKDSVNENNVNDEQAPDPFLLQGTTLDEGEVKRAIVLAVGENTATGSMELAPLQGYCQVDQSPLQQKLEGVGEGLGKLGRIVALFTFIALIVSIFVKTSMDDTHGYDIQFATDICDGFVFAFIVIVVAMPDGLPFAVVTGLAF